MTEEEFKNMFAKYGNVNEVFVNGERGFGLIRLVCVYCSVHESFLRAVALNCTILIFVGYCQNSI